MYSLDCEVHQDSPPSGGASPPTRAVRCVMGGFNGLMRPRWGMVADVVIYAGFISILAALFWGIREVKITIESGLEDLDGAIASAIQSIAQNLAAGGLEPVNPFQQMLAQYIGSQLNKPGLPLLDRDAAGKFQNDNS